MVRRPSKSIDLIWIDSEFYQEVVSSSSVVVQQAQLPHHTGTCPERRRVIVDTTAHQSETIRHL